MNTQTEKFLDVTKLPPQVKHATIFKAVEYLKEGESLVLHNDHDPKPLYYQLSNMLGNVFTWEYLQEGPVDWEVRIAIKRMPHEAETQPEKTEAQPEHFLDVTKLAPPVKHPTIFEWFDHLKAGEYFILHNDHDPKPLYYQLLGERGKCFKWEYLEQGPDVYEIRIEKLTEEAKETVGELTAKDYRKAEVFKKLGIDFCCNGDKTLAEAGKEVGVSEAQIRKALAEAADTPAGGKANEYDKWDLDFLADYIRQTHHRYVKENGEILTGLAAKIAKVHGARHPELVELAPRITAVIETFLEHMDKEEKVVFPAIKKLVSKKEEGAAITLEAGSVSQPIKVMEAEHDHTGDELKYFREITKDYELPEDACNSYRYFFEKMQEFEADTFLHVHLENNILFPKAIKLEKELTV